MINRNAAIVPETTWHGTPDKAKAEQIASVKKRVDLLRKGGTGENDIPVALFREGWPAGAVNEVLNGKTDT